MQLDEALVGGKGGPHKELVLVAAEANGRARLVHVENNDAETCKRFVEGDVAVDAHVVTDGHAGYNRMGRDGGPDDAVVQNKVDRRENDSVHGCHWKISVWKCWHAGAERDKYQQALLDVVVPPQPPRDQGSRQDRSMLHWEHLSPDRRKRCKACWTRLARIMHEGDLRSG